MKAPRSRTHGCAIVGTVLLGFVSACTTPIPRKPVESIQLTSPLPASIGNLRDAFRAEYDEAVEAHSERLRASAPIITQDLLNMTLWRSDGTTARFPMNSRAYMLMAHSSHPPLTVFSILSSNGFGSLTDSTKQKLKDYVTVLEGAAGDVYALDIPIETRDRLVSILMQTRQFVVATLAKGSATEADFQSYAQPLKELISANLRVGANEQLVQFRTQVNAWRTEFPDEKWSELRVVVLGVHQARDQYALKLFFQWLLREPAYEDRVVYAELQTLPRGDALAEAQKQALTLLTKVDFEHKAGALIFGDRFILQKDVMGPAAEDILEAWGTSDWPAAR
ncbi:hypothetical protein [Peristeroidobacter soli]|uniref:hypothetical protein n=1 Tax=Peristeroidobacter soli TaxID=2497877 RepID=UPI00101DFCDC|nr:hypothetical protein [Peristeroidobacter soli]